MTNNNDQTSSYDIVTLNGLIATTIDSVEGYREAAEDAQNPRFKTMFMDRAAERREIVATLQTQVRSLGGDPEDDGTVLAGAHRMFMGLRDLVSGNDDVALIAEVERGEDHIKAKYENALTDRDLSPSTASLIESCFKSVREGHDQMSNLNQGLTNSNAM